MFTFSDKSDFPVFLPGRFLKNAVFFNDFLIARKGEAADACFCQSNTPAAAFLAGFGLNLDMRGGVRFASCSEILT